MTALAAVREADVKTANWLRASARALRRPQGTGRLLGLTLALGAAFAIACSDDGPTPPAQHQHSVSAVALDPTSLTLLLGDEATLSATATCSCGQVLAREVEWASSDEAVAAVDEAGGVSAVSWGTATITATVDGKTGSVAVAVNPVGTLIGPEGGTVVSSDGNLELVVPAEALATETDIVVAPVDDSEFVGDELFVSATAYEMKPAGLELAKPASLKIHFDPGNVPGDASQEQLRIRERDRERDRWQDCDHQGMEGQGVKASIDHLGTYGIVVQPASQELIGPAGGTVVSLDGNAILEIPAGALEEPTAVVLSVVEDPAFADDEQYISGTAYDVQPEGLELAKPASLRLHFDPADVPSGTDASELRIQRRDRVQSQWQAAQHVAVDASDHSVEAGVVTFGTYAILGPPSDGGGSPTVASVLVSPVSITLDEGETLQATAVAKDADGNVLDVDFTWSSADVSVATVDDAGLVTGVAEGTTTISASADGKKGSASAQVNKKIHVGSVSVIPASAYIVPGGTVQLTAEVRDVDDNVVDFPVTWKSSANAYATVDQDGVVTGVAVGDATITADADGVTGTAQITVDPPVASIVITAPSNRNTIEPPNTLLLTATAYDAAGQPVAATLTWASSNEDAATVDQIGLVTAISAGNVTITASFRAVTGSYDLKVVGEVTTEAGNNMSWPVVFVDGIGLTGSAVATDPGVRPLAEEGITVDTLPFFWSGNTCDVAPDADPTAAVYCPQGTADTWRAVYVDGTGQQPYEAEAYWGDNLVSKTWKVGQKLRVEVALSATGVGTLTGYVMTLLANPSSPDESQGTDGTTADFTPLIYTPGPTFIVEQLDGQGGNVVATIQSGTISAELNVGGRVVYGGQITLQTAGWYRLRFVLASGANARITSVGNAAGVHLPYVVNATETAMEIQITP